MAQAKTLKVKKKRWISIVAPQLFNNAFLGEVLVGEPEEAIGRDITVSLMVITGDPKRQATHISFKIEGIQDGNLVTSVKGMQVLPNSVRRLVRRNKERVDDSFDIVTNDGKKLRIKPMIVTRNSTSRSICSKLKAKSRDYLIRALARSPLDKFVLDLNSYKFQKEMAQSLSKIYPVSICEIRSFKVIGTGTPPVLPPEPAEQPKEVAEPIEEPAESKPAQESAEDEPKKKSRAKKGKSEDGSEEPAEENEKSSE